MTKPDQPSKPVNKHTIRPNKYPKIKKAFNAILENEALDKPKPLKQVLQSVGYTENSSKQPSSIIKTKTFQQLMDKAGITTEVLSNKLYEGLNATKIAGKSDIEHPDYATRHRYLETALRLKGLQEGIVQHIAPTFPLD